MSIRKVESELEKSVIQVMLKEPFFGHFLSNFQRSVTDDEKKTKTVGIRLSKNKLVYININKGFWLSINEMSTDADRVKALKTGVLKHNILHIIFKHITKQYEFGDKRLFGIATDLVVNQYLSEKQLMDDAITLDMFTDFQLDTEQTIEYYYRTLKKAWEDIQQKESQSGQSSQGESQQGDGQPQSSGGSQQGDDNQEGQGSQGNNNTHQGDNSQGGDNSEGEDDQKGDNSEGDGKPQGGGDNHLNESEKNLKNLMGDEENQHLDQHNGWDAISDLSSGERKGIENAINEAIKNTVKRCKDKMHGTLPAGLQAHIDQLLESLKPNVNWKRKLKLFTNNASRTYLKQTVHRVSKRYGTTPSNKITPKCKLLVAIDTSGSVNDDELKEFFGEIKNIHKTKRTEIHVVECDTQIGNKYEYKGEMPEVISGRGGTDFNAPIQYANEELKPDAIIYFTDGYAPNPEVPNRIPILWLISSDGLEENDWDSLEGRKVKMAKQVF